MEMVVRSPIQSYFMDFLEAVLIANLLLAVIGALASMYRFRHAAVPYWLRRFAWAAIAIHLAWGVLGLITLFADPAWPFQLDMLVIVEAPALFGLVVWCTIAFCRTASAQPVVTWKDL